MPTLRTRVWALHGAAPALLPPPAALTHVRGRRAAGLAWSADPYLANATVPGSALKLDLTAKGNVRASYLYSTFEGPIALPSGCAAGPAADGTAGKVLQSEAVFVGTSSDAMPFDAFARKVLGAIDMGCVQK